MTLTLNLLEDTKPREFSRFSFHTKKEMSRMQFQHFNREKSYYAGTVKSSISEGLWGPCNQQQQQAVNPQLLLAFLIQAFPYPWKPCSLCKAPHQPLQWPERKYWFLYIVTVVGALELDKIKSWWPQRKGLVCFWQLQLMSVATLHGQSVFWTLHEMYFLTKMNVFNRNDGRTGTGRVSARGYY